MEFGRSDFNSIGLSRGEITVVGEISRYKKVVELGPGRKNSRLIPPP